MDDQLLAVASANLAANLENLAVNERMLAANSNRHKELVDEIRELKALMHEVVDTMKEVSVYGGCSG